MTISPTLQAAVADLIPLEADGKRWLALRDLQQLVAHHEYNNDISDADVYAAITKQANALAAACGYGQPTVLTPPTVPFDAEGPYVAQLPPVDATLMTTLIEQIGGPYVDDQQPLRYVRCNHIWEAAAQAIHQQPFTALAPAVSEPFAQSLTAFFTSNGWELSKTGRHTRYERPLTARTDKAEAALVDYIQGRSGALSARELQRELTRLVYDKPYVIGDHNAEAFADIMPLLNAALTMCGYALEPQQGRYEPLPFTVSDSMATQLADALTSLPRYETEFGQALFFDEVSAAISQLVTPETGETLAAYHAEELLRSEQLQQLLVKRHFKATPQWVAGRRFRPKRQESTRCFVSRFNLIRDVEFQVALDKQSALPVVAPICVLDEQESRIICLRLIGNAQAVKANWASLVQSHSSVIIDGKFIRQRGMKQHILLKAQLPMGLHDWVLLHKQASLIQMNPAHPFYVLDDQQQPVPPSFFAMLDKALSTPLQPQWATFLWEEGLFQRLIAQARDRSHGYIGWRVQSDQERWRGVIQEGLQAGKLQLLVDGEAVAMPAVTAIMNTSTEPQEEALPLLSAYTIEDAIDDEALQVVAASDIAAQLPPVILKAQFPLGQVVMTPGVETLIDDGLDAIVYLQRHATCDWGDLEAEDVASNNRALTDGTRLFSSYETPHGKLWIITEADRHATTLLQRHEY